MLRFMLILTAVVCLIGCKSGGGGSDSDSLSFSGGDYSNESGYTDNLGGSSDSGGSNDFVGLNPEPATLTLFGIGLGGLILSALKRKKNKNKE